MAITDQQQIRQTRELIKATDELLESQKALAQLEKDAIKAEEAGQKEELKLLRKKQDAIIKESDAINSRILSEKSRQESIEAAAEASTEKTEENQAKTRGAVNKSIAAMEKQSESFLSSIPFLRDFGESLGDPGKKNLLIFTAGMAAGVVEMTRLTKNLLDLNSVAPLAFGSFSEGLIGTSELMFDTGLAAGELKEVFKAFPGTFRKFKTQIGDAADANEDLVLSLGLTREEFTKQTVQAIALADAMGRGVDNQDQLNQTAREYVIELNALAIQTGRQADEIEEQRAGAVQSMALFLTTLPEDVRAGFVGGIAEINRQTPQLLEQISGIFQTVDPGEAIQKANDFAIAARAMTEGMDDAAGVVPRFLDIQAAAAAGNEEARRAFGPAARDFAKFMAENTVNVRQQSAALVGATPGVQAAAEAFASMSNDVTGLASATGQSRKQMLENADATRRQTEIVGDAIKEGGAFAEFMFDASKLLSVFGADLTNIGIFLFGLSKTLTAIGPALSLFKSAVIVGTAPFVAAFALLTFSVLAVVSRWDRIVEGLITIGNDLNENFIQPFLEFIKPHVGAIVLMFQDFRDFIEPWVPLMKEVFNRLLDIFLFFPRKIADFIGNIIPDGLKSFFELLIINIKELLPDIGSLLGGDDPDSLFSKAKNFFGGDEEKNVVTPVDPVTQIPDSAAAGATAAQGRRAPATAAAPRSIAVLEPKLPETEINVGSTEKQILIQVLETLREMNKSQFVAVQLADKTSVNTERTARNTNVNAPRRRTSAG